LRKKIFWRNKLKNTLYKINFCFLNWTKIHIFYFPKNIYESYNGTHRGSKTGNYTYISCGCTLRSSPPISGIRGISCNLIVLIYTFHGFPPRLFNCSISPWLWKNDLLSRSYILFWSPRCVLGNKKLIVHIICIREMSYIFSGFYV
jgi:hypothetical protein